MESSCARNDFANDNSDIVLKFPVDSNIMILKVKNKESYVVFKQTTSGQMRDGRLGLLIDVDVELCT